MSDTLKEFNTRVCSVCGWRGRGPSCPHDGTTTHPKGAVGLVGLVLKERYRLLQHLGSGGMGTVYKAEHLRLQTMVAVKILDTSIASEQSEQYQRFHREGQVINSLVHPNIVRALDFDLEQGKPFLVMDFIDGISLQDVLKRSGSMEVKRALNIFTQICDALGYAHNNGILHRDLKPGNVMLVSGPIREDRVKLLDFGLAKLIDEDAKKLTDPGTIFGTPLYMSPEQCLGSQMDHRSDIYSLGCLMYELLAGRPPIKGISSIDTIQKQINEQPLSLAEQRTQEVPPGLVAVVMKCLEKSPDDRPSSMAELKTMLERSLLPASFAEPAPVPGKPPSSVMLLLQLALAAVVLLVTGGAVAYIVMPPRTPAPNSTAVSPEQSSSLKQPAERRIDVDPPGEPTAQSATPGSPEHINSLEEKASNLYLAGKRDEADNFILQATNYRKRNGPSAELAQDFLYLCESCMLKKSFSKMLGYSQEAEQQLKQSHIAPEDQRFGDVDCYQAWALLDSKSFAKAEAKFQRALAVHKSGGPGRNAWVKSDLRGLAQSLTAQGKSKEATKYSQELAALNQGAK